MQAVADHSSDLVAVLERTHKEQCVMEEGVNQTLLKCNDFKPIARIIAEARHPRFLLAYCPDNTEREGRCFIMRSDHQAKEKIPQSFLDKLREDVVTRPSEQFYYFWEYSRDDFFEDLTVLGLPMLAAYMLTTQHYRAGWVIATLLFGNLVLSPVGNWLGNLVRSDTELQSRKKYRSVNQSTSIIVEAVSFQAGCITKLGYISIKYKEIWAYELFRRLYFRAQSMFLQTGYKVTSALVAVGSSTVGLTNRLGSGVTEEVDFSLPIPAHQFLELAVIVLFIVQDTVSLLEDYNRIDDRSDSAADMVRTTLEGHSIAQ
ncbi:MAG: hypothetical protein ACR2PX_05285 [Endozoicomonas sp.]|uniref:hypothetical protein n=1 Tax=Endozoicomonas sp. TaxID=1892382 RepID=UPI003D9BB33D